MDHQASLQPEEDRLPTSRRRAQWQRELARDAPNTRQSLPTPLSRPFRIPNPIKQTCLAIHTFLIRIHTLTLQTFNGLNLSHFLTELALGIRGLLLDHFRKFTVNAAGGLMVTKDLTKYTEILRSWPLDPSFAPSVEILNELGNLFVVGPEALRERVRAWVTRGLVEGRDLKGFLLKREDGGSVGVQSVINSLANMGEIYVETALDA